MTFARTTRRRILRGAGVALALPWLESLAPRPARTATLAKRPRYIALMYPNGVARDWWLPKGQGEGNAWSLSPILEPLGPVKAKTSVLTNVGNVSAFNNQDPNTHSRQCAATWTCVDMGPPDNTTSGISVDQVVAGEIARSIRLPLASLQVGLATRNESTENHPPQHSRSISWASATEPLYKVVNPQAVFDRLVASGGAGMRADPAAQAAADVRRRRRASVLDAVLDLSGGLRPRMSASDRTKMDQFLSSVRELERRVGAPEMQVPSGGGTCTPTARPSQAIGVDAMPPGYHRGDHASLMIDLVVLALQCDLTRVVSFMLDDERSGFVYDFLAPREFSPSGSQVVSGSIGDYHEHQHAPGPQYGFATICRYNSEKAAELAIKLDGIAEEEGRTLLDDTVITFASAMDGPGHSAHNLPVVLLGGGAGVLKAGHHLVFGAEQRIADVHLTILRRVFGYGGAAFGTSSGELAELLV